MKKILNNLVDWVYDFALTDFFISLAWIFFPIQLIQTMPFRTLGAFPFYFFDITIKTNSKLIMNIGLFFVLLKLITAILLKKRKKFAHFILIVFCLLEIIFILHFYITTEITNMLKIAMVFVGLISCLFYTALIVLSILNLKDPKYKEKEVKKYSTKENWNRICSFLFVIFGVESAVAVSFMLDKFLNFESLEVSEIHPLNPKVFFLVDEWVLSKNQIFVILILLLMIMQIVLVILSNKNIKMSIIALGAFYIVDLIFSIYELYVAGIFLYALFVAACISRYKQLQGTQSRDDVL